MAKKKRKSKLKKFLKGAALAGAVALGAKALAGRNKTAANVDSGRGSGLRKTNVGKQFTYTPKDDIMTFPNKGVAIGVDYNAGPFERSQIAPYIKGIDRSPVDRRNKNNFLNINRVDDYLMSKGGRVGVGKAKRGFGRAMKKGRKK